jgi:hypothetical protein
MVEMADDVKAGFFAVKQHELVDVILLPKPDQPFVFPPAVTVFDLFRVKETDDVFLPRYVIFRLA